MKNIAKMFILTSLIACPMMASAYDFGVIDAAQVFNKYNETQKTKTMLETKKATLQADLEKRKEEVKKLDEEYVKLAKETQELRDKKKDVSAKEKKLTDLRKNLAVKQSELQKFFETSQRDLYALEEKEMGSLSKSLDSKVDSVISKISKNYKLKAVFEKRSMYWQDPTACKDITEEVIKSLNSGK